MQTGKRSGKNTRACSLEVLPLDMKKYSPALLRFLRFIRSKQVALINAHGYHDHLLSMLAGIIPGIKVVRTKHNHKPLKGGPFGRFIYGSLTDRIVAISDYIRDTLVKSGLPLEHLTTIHTAINLKTLFPQPRNQELLKSFTISQKCPIID